MFFLRKEKYLNVFRADFLSYIIYSGTKREHWPEMKYGHKKSEKNYSKVALKF